MTQSTETSQIVKDNVDRATLQDNLIESIIDGMDHKTMWSVLYDYMNESYDKYSNEELITEVKEYYPELLEGKVLHYNKDCNVSCITIE